jgi:hypothetical protein
LTRAATNLVGAAPLTRAATNKYELRTLIVMKFFSYTLVLILVLN